MARAKRNINDKYNSTFAMRLRECVDDQGISQADLATSVNKTRQAVNNYTLGETVPDADTLFLLSKKLNVSVDYLIGLSNAKITATEDEKLKIACDYTGLSEKAVFALKEIKDNGREQLSIYDSLISSYELNLIVSQILEITSLTEISYVYAKVCNKVSHFKTGSQEYRDNADIYDKYYYNEQEAEKEIFLLQKHFVDFIETLTSRNELKKYIEDNKMTIVSYKDGKYLYDLDEIADERYEKEIKKLEQLKEKYREWL